MLSIWKKIDSNHKIKAGQRVINIGRHSRLHWQATIIKVGIGVVQIQYDESYWKSKNNIWDLDPLGCRWLQEKSLRRHFEMLEENTMGDENKKFFMVMGDGTPRVRHTTLHSAKYEAERLAKNHPGTQFFVLQALCVVQTNDVQTRILHD